MKLPQRHVLLHDGHVSRSYSNVSLLKYTTDVGERREGVQYCGHDSSQPSTNPTQTVRLFVVRNASIDNINHLIIYFKNRAITEKNHVDIQSMPSNVTHKDDGCCS
jgi:hypothetical protein